MATGFMHTVISRLRNRCLAHKCRVIERKPYHGYQGGRTRHFVQLVFSSMRDFRSAKYACKEANWATFESACDPLLKFFHVNKLDPVGWTHVDNPIPVTGDEKTARPNVSEWTVASFRDISMSTDPEVIATIPPLVIASWDIECVSAKGGFPDGANPEDKLITIGTAYMKYGESEPFKNTVHQLKSCDPVEGVEIHAYEAEQDLINAWIEEIGEMHVDVLLGFNVWGFDSKYIDDRSTCLIDFRTGDSAVNLSLFGKAVDGGGERVEKQLQSAAYGSNKYIFHATPGVLQLDLLTIFRKELKLASYTLNNVAKTYLGGEEKIDLKPKEIFECFKGTSADRARIAEYCVRDCALPLYLMNKLNVLTNQLEMSKVVCCPVSFLNLRGQQIRCYSQIVRKAREHGFVVDDFDKKGDGGGYVGATVLEPQAGAYMMDIVSCLDFGSLYPSIIRAHKMDLSTIVNEPVYDHLDGVEYYRVETTPGKIVTFAQTDDAVVPALLDDLAAWRTQAKRDMAGAKERGDAFAASLYNAKQLAYKVSSNSVYGLFGSATGMLPCVDMASAVTSTGRDMIQTTKAKVMEYNPGARVVYGDSVAPYTPIHIRWNRIEYELTTFELLADRLEWTTRDDGKEYAVPVGLETWSDAGWTTVRAVIRHAHVEPLVRVCTHTGIVDVTRDHSLLRPDGSMVKPSEVTVGDKLLHATLPEIQQGEMPYALTDNRLYSFSKALGFFMGDGSCGRYRCPSGMKCSWAMNNSNRDMLTEYSAIMSSLYPDIEWRILDTMHSSRVYKLVPKCDEYGRISELVDEWRLLCYRGKSKIVPGFIYNAPVQVMKSFIYGFDDADGDKNSTFRMDQKTQLSAAALYRLYVLAGYSVSITSRPDKPNIFRLNASRQKLRREPTGIKKMMTVQSVGMVYDFTTDNHHFSGGVGELVVHNTDSVFAIFNCGQENRQNLAAHMKMAQEMADRITTCFRRPNILEYEKCYFPWLLFSKKRYCGLMFETDPDKSVKIDVKGLQVVRRDNCGLVREVSQEVMDILMYKRSFSMALDHARKRVLDVLNENVSWDSMVVSKALRGNYKNPKSLPHWQVAEKRKARGEAITSGERIPYVFIRDPLNSDGLVAERAEDPVFAKTNGLPLDTLYYVRQQLLNPICTLLSPQYADPSKEILGEPDIAVKMLALQVEESENVKESKRVKRLKKENQREITSFFSKKVKE